MTTQEKSAQRKNCRNEDFFPSRRLGRKSADVMTISLNAVIGRYRWKWEKSLVTNAEDNTRCQIPCEHQSHGRPRKRRSVGHFEGRTGLYHRTKQTMTMMVTMTMMNNILFPYT